MCFTKKGMSNKRKPLTYGKENTNSGEVPEEQINRLQNDLYAQTVLIQELQKQLTDSHKLIHECHDIIKKQNAKIQLLENQMEHEKKKNLSGSDNPDSSPDKT